MVSSLPRKANIHVTRFARLTRFCGSVSSRNFIPGGGKDDACGRGSRELQGASQVVNFTGKGRVCAYMCKASARRLSRGIGSVDDPKGRNEQKSSASDVGRSTPIIEPEDLSDLNTEIASYVGSLGDPDFDIQEDLSLTMLEPGAPPPFPMESSDTGRVKDEASMVNIARNHSTDESAFRTDHYRGDKKRLTLADDPSSEIFRTNGGQIGDTNAGCSQTTASDDFGSFETLGSTSTSGGTSSFRGEPKPGRDNEESEGMVKVEHEGEKPPKKR